MAASSVCRAGCAAGRALLRGPRPSVSHRGGGSGEVGRGEAGEGSERPRGVMGLPGPDCRPAGKVTGTRRPVRGGRRSPWKPRASRTGPGRAGGSGGGGLHPLRGLPGACCPLPASAPVSDFDRFMGLFAEVFDLLETSGAAEGFQPSG